MLTTLSRAGAKPASFAHTCFACAERRSILAGNSDAHRGNSTGHQLGTKTDKAVRGMGQHLVMLDTHTVTLVGFNSPQLKRAAPASDLYTEPRFKLAAQVAARTGPWFVLSAKFGLLRPDAVIEPYRERLGDGRRGSPNVHTWADKILDSLQSLYPYDRPTLRFLTGDQQSLPAFKTVWPTQRPLRGMAAAEQLQWLREESRAATA